MKGREAGESQRDYDDDNDHDDDNEDGEMSDFFAQQT